MAGCDRIGLRPAGAPEFGEILVGTDVTGGVAAGDVRWVLSGPPDVEGLIVIAGSSFSGARHAAVRRTMLRELHRAGFAVLSVDLLDPSCAEDRGRIDVPSCAARLAGAALSMPTAWPGRHRPIGLLGAGPAAAVAFWAAADLGRLASAVVCWSGRLDPVGPRLADVTAATLLVVGDRDDDGMARNIELQGGLRCPTHLRVVRRATEFFTEPGTLADVETATVAWFIRHLIGEPEIPRSTPLDLAG